jgi:alpha-beta hydrolase superfamily lysophospholipase
MISFTFDLFGIHSMLHGHASEGTRYLCGILPEICQYGEGFFITQNPSLDDPLRFQNYMGHFPAGASTQSLIHYAQMMKRNDWKLYDWGSALENFKRYGQTTPPKVKIQKITEIPTAMFVGTADSLGDVTDARWARDTIKSAGNALVHYEEVEAGHSTFMIGKNMTYFNNVLNLLNTYNPIELE